MQARIDGSQVKLLTRTGLDWSHRYRRTIEALGSLKVKSAYLDGELCALNADGVTRSSSTSEVPLHSHLASAGAAIACSVAVINRRTPSAPTFEEAPGWRRSHLRPRDAYSVRRVQLGARRKERRGRYSEQRPSAHAQMRLLHWCRPLLPN